MTPTTTTSVAPSDSVTRTRPARQLSWPTTPATNPAAATYPIGAAVAWIGQTAAKSAATAVRMPTVPTTRGAGGRTATVQASTNRAWIPKITTAYGIRAAPTPADWAPKINAAPSSPAKPATASDSSRRTGTASPGADCLGCRNSGSGRGGTVTPRRG